MKPTELIWLANGVIKRLNQHKPTRGGTAEEADDPGEAQNAFIGLFGIMLNTYGSIVVSYFKVLNILVV